MSPWSSVLKRLESFHFANDRVWSQMLLWPWGQTQLLRLNLLNCINKKEKGQMLKDPEQL